jgi:hypothetical protein
VTSGKRGGNRLPIAIGAPVAINFLLFSGLLAALMSEQAGRYFAWIAVASPVVVALWFYLRRFRSDK